MGTLSGTAQPETEERGFRRLWRVLKQLFHEVTGALFAIMALAWLNAGIRAWTRDVAPWLIALAACIAVIFGFFSATQFRRARKVR